MKNLTLLLLLAASTLLSINALAAKVKCTPAKFENLYAKDGTVYIQLRGLPWHVLGYEGDSDLDKKMRRIERAQRKDRYLQLVFPNGYSDDTCMMIDRSIAVKKVKVKKYLEEPDEEEDTD
jgi:hypothetical protein